MVQCLSFSSNNIKTGELILIQVIGRMAMVRVGYFLAETF